MADNEALVEEARSVIAEAGRKKTKRELFIIVKCKAFDHTGYQ